MVLLDISPLQIRNFRFLYLSQFISLLGSQMTVVTIPFQIFGLTNSTFQTGLVSAIELVCLVATALLGGVIADKFDRRKIIVRSELIMMCLVVLLMVNSLLPEPSLWLIYVLAGIISGVNGFHRPAFEALTPTIVAKHDLPKVSSLMSLKFVSASLVGPTLAGFLVASIGSLWTYLIDASSFMISIALLSRLALEKSDHTAGAQKIGSVFREIIEGARYVYSRKDILASYIIDFFAMVFCMPQVLFPAFAKFYGKEQWLGTLYASVAFGGLAASLVSRWATKIDRLGVGIFCAAGGWAFSILLVGISGSFWMLPIGLFLAGLCDCYSGLFRTTMWNESLPDTHRGRIASFGMISYTSGPLLGNTFMGFFGDFLGLHKALIFGGTISIVAMSIVMFFLPAFWAYRSSFYNISR